jgi:hypothetical protein
MSNWKGFKRSSLVMALSVCATVASLTPAANAAGARVFCLQTYGHEVPAQPCEKNPNLLQPYDYSGKVYPNSLLYVSSLGSQGSFVTAPTGSIYVEGNATPGSRVAISVTDGIRTLGPFTVDAEPADGGGARAGDFFAEIMVSELGSHVATPGADPDNVGDDELGPTTLTITAQATDGMGSAGPLTDTIVKHAATEGDTFKPRLVQQRWPSLDMDHICSQRQVEDAVNGSQELIFGDWILGFSEKSACTYHSISGSILDHYNGSNGTASEISDVRIEITKEELGQTFLDVKHSTDTPNLPPTRGPILTRYASNVSKYSYIFNINDLPPNDLALVGLDDFYTVTVTVCDAWGNVMSPSATNCVVSSQGDIIVHSY